MSRNILITGASGYLGGSIVAKLAGAGLPPHGKIFALIRTDKQAESVKEYGLEPLTFDLRDERAVEESVVGNNISVVYFLVNATSSEAQTFLIKALAKVKRATGQEVHLLHTSGAKLFSSLAGAPTDKPLLDTDPGLYDIQKNQKAEYPPLQPAVDVNCAIIDMAEAHGVRSYIFVPCIVYGKGLGFGNVTSIQNVAIVKAAREAGRVYRVDNNRPTWAVSHISDTANLYIEILRKILSGGEVGFGKKGYFLASSGSVAWDDVYAAMAKALAKRGVIETDEVTMADEAALEKMAAGLHSPVPLVRVQLGGNCTFVAKHGEALGWKSEYAADHIVEAADEEVELILNNH